MILCEDCQQLPLDPTEPVTWLVLNIDTLLNHLRKPNMPLWNHITKLTNPRNLGSSFWTGNWMLARPAVQHGSAVLGEIFTFSVHRWNLQTSILSQVRGKEMKQRKQHRNTKISEGGDKSQMWGEWGDVLVWGWNSPVRLWWRYN